jgi:hypothetical protein
MPESDLPAARHETQDIGFRPLVVGLGLTLLVLLLCTRLAMWLYPGATVDRRLPTALPEFPSPRLQANPSADLRRFQQQEMARLNGSGWVDRAHGIVHIPIDDAMRRIAGQGIPDWPAAKMTAAQ